MNAFRVIERLERINNLGGQNTESVKNRLRKLGNVQSKIINHLWSRTFNSVCINRNILPNYVNF